ncbi:hypothetical protein LCGC14_1136230 [marine sediment metagenome]|uniref:Uncharacterized protein n=1 Tax=marine sediment metagenome TaxID=412755 RepID=A0A0F9PHT8_9ZZZZ
MKKKVLIIFLGVISLMFALVAFYATANPNLTGDHDTCHNSPGGYTIMRNSTGIIEANQSSVVHIEITATGSNLFVQAYAGSKDNNEFVNILPTTVRIVDNSVNDTNPAANNITVVFTITTPATKGFYNLFIIAGDNNAGQPDFAYANIEFSIGGVAKPKPDYLGRFFSHSGFYVIGGIAIISLATGTILYLINQEKFTKAHGLLAGTSLILTTINIIVVLPATISVLPVVANLPLHFLHIILGVIGYGAGIIAFLAGLSGHRSRLPGFIALGCWGFNYIQGLLSIFLGVGF